ncbi:uncharacterized protein D12 [Battus philenor]|uniref:uncharacterized protein D12 n=1 Tax=Battus philenor TaxID=42288 RepID=UPI0035D0D543
MDCKQEYHDPDYPEASVSTKERPPSLSEKDKLEKIKNIIRKEFGNELDIRENEVMLADQRMLTARRALHKLRYTIVNSYYKEQKLQLSSSQLQDELAAQSEPRARAEASELLRDGQRQIHPSVRKLLGKKNVDLQEIFKIREPRNKSRKNYSAMIQSRNITVPADSTKTLRPETQKPLKMEPHPSEATENSDKPKKVPRHLEPKVENVVTLDEVTRNKIKHRYRIIIGNTSKYAPGASRADRSTHTWLLYVRGAASILRAVSVRLHHSYAPHHLVRLEKPPFHVSRRGWGEFPARVELHFALPERNRPATVDHTIRLDRLCTGLQTLGSETVVDVWLYSTPEMLEHEYKDDETPKLPPQEPTKVSSETQNDYCSSSSNSMNEVKNDQELNETNNSEKLNDSWLEFFSKESTELNVDEMLVKNVKKEVMDFENIEDGTDFMMNNTDDSRCNNSILYEQLTKENDKNNFKISKPTDELPTEILNQSTCLKKRIMKYMDPTTRKIYYLEMDRDLDLSKVQEIVINSQGNVNTAKIMSNGLKHVKKMKSGTSLLKPEVKNLLKKDTKYENHKVSSNFTHIENDHCYIRAPRYPSDTEDEELCAENQESDKLCDSDDNLYETLCSAVLRFHSVRTAVNYLLKKIPLINVKANDPDYVKYFPFVVECEEKYWKLDFAKRRNIEWSRAKLIKNIMTEYLKTDEQIWQTKQILVYSRLHGFYPIRTENILEDFDKQNDEWSSWNFGDDSQRTVDTKTQGCSSSGLSSLTLFDSEPLLCNTSFSDPITLSDSDEEIDIVKCESKVKVKSEVVPETSLEVLPVDNEEDRLRFMFVERKCVDIGIELRNEDVGNGYSYSAVHAVLLSAVRSFAEELLRAGLAATTEQDDPAMPQVWARRARRTCIFARDVWAGLRSTTRLQALTARGLGATERTAHAL